MTQGPDHQPAQPQPAGSSPHHDYQRQAAQHFEYQPTAAHQPPPPAPAARVPVNRGVQLWNIGRDVVAGALLLVALLLPWNIYFGTGISYSNAGIDALLVLVTLLSWGSIAATYAGYWRMFGSGFDANLVCRLRLALNIPYLLLVGGFVVFDVIQTLGNGTSSIPGGIGPGAWLGTAGALLAGQPVIANLADTDSRRQTWLSSTRIVAFASMGLAGLGVLISLFWTVKITSTAGAGQITAVLLTSVVASAVSLGVIVLVGWWLLRSEPGAQLAVVALGAATLAAGFIVRALPIGGSGAYRGIAQHTSALSVGYPGYLAWVAAAAILAPTTLARLWAAKPVDKNVVRDVAGKGLLFAVVWCGGRALVYVVTLMASVMGGLSGSPYYTIALFAFNAVTAGLAGWLLFNLANAKLPAALITALCGVLAILMFARLVVSHTLGDDTGSAAIIGGVSIADQVLLLVALAVLAAMLFVNGLLDGLRSKLQPSAGATPSGPGPFYPPPPPAAAAPASSPAAPTPVQPPRIADPTAATDHIDLGALSDGRSPAGQQPPPQLQPPRPPQPPAPPPQPPGWPGPAGSPGPPGPAGWAPPGQPPGFYPGAPRPTNSMAIVALVTSLVLAPLGIIFGHIALSKIKRTGEDGRGLAIAGLVIGYLGTAVVVAWLVFFLVVVVSVGNWFNQVDSAISSYPTSTTYRSTVGTPDSGDIVMQNAEVGDCIRRTGSGSSLTITTATCGSNSSTHRVTRITDDTDDCSYYDGWISTRVYSPLLVLCLDRD